MTRYRHLAKRLLEAAKYANDLADLDRAGDLDDGHYVFRLKHQLNVALRQAAITHGCELVTHDDPYALDAADEAEAAAASNVVTLRKPESVS